MRPAHTWVKFLTVSFFLTFAFAASSAQLPSLEMYSGTKLIYDLHSNPQKVFVVKRGESPRLIYEGPLTKIQVTHLNGAEIPESVQVEKVYWPHDILTYFNTATNKSAVVMETGDTYVFNAGIQDISAVGLRDNKSMISIQHSSGDALTFFFDGQARRDINKEFYHGILAPAQTESASSIAQWGGKPIYYTDANGKKANIVYRYVPRFSQFLASPPQSSIMDAYRDKPATAQKTNILSKELLAQFERNLRVSKDNMDLETAHALIDMRVHSDQMIPALTEIALQAEKETTLWPDSSELKSRHIERSTEAVDLLAKYADIDPKALDVYQKISTESKSQAARKRAVLNSMQIQDELPSAEFMKCFLKNVKRL